MKKITAHLKKFAVLYAAALVVIVVAGVFTGRYILSGNNNDEDPQIDTSSETRGGNEDAESSDIDADTREKVFSKLELLLPDGEHLVSSVSAIGSAGQLIKTDSELVLTTVIDVTPDELAAVIQLSPETEFTVEKEAPSIFRVKTKKPLPDDSIIRLELKGADGVTERSWAFQTEGEFRVVSVFPANEATYAPINSGIEIAFSHDVDMNDISGSFQIQPHVEGQFQRYRKTWVFVPANDLETDTQYTVTIDKNLTSAAGAQLAEDKVFTFSTHGDGWGTAYFYPVGGLTETFLENDPCVVEMYCLSSHKDSPVSLKLFRYPDSSAYKKALWDCVTSKTGISRYTFKTDGLTEIYSFDGKLEYADEYSYGANYFILPDNLTEGYYLADMSMNTNGQTYTAQYHIQINPVSVFTAAVPNETLLYVNDTKSGGAAAGARVTIETQSAVYNGVTDALGTALINTASDTNEKGIMTLEYEGHIFIDAVDMTKKNAAKPHEDYYIYLYTDREIYLTTDTIRVWGTVIPRNREAAPLGALCAGLYEGSDPIQTKNIELNQDGTFTIEIEYNSVEASWGYNISLFSDDTLMTRKWTEISDYVKPTYVMNASAPYFAAFPHITPIQTEASLNFFEGTPVVGAQIRVSTGFDEKSVVTNEHGYGKATILIADYDNWRPISRYIDVSLSGIENEYQYVSNSIYCIYRDVMLETDKVGNNLHIKTSAVDYANFEQKHKNPKDEWLIDSYYSYNYIDYAAMLRGAPVDTEVTGTLTRTWWTKTLTGSKYDFITKRNYEIYNYERHEAVVGVYTIYTSEGAGVFNNLPLDDENSTYTMELEWKDSRGGVTKETIRLTTAAETYNSYQYPRSSYNLTGNASFNENQHMEFTLYNNNNPAAINGGRILFTVANDRFITSEIKESAVFTHAMREEYIPNIWVGGAYFDGRHVYRIEYRNRYYDPKEREISVTVQAGAELYAPGEDAVITLTAKDTSGRAISGAAVSISVVDEAVFAVKEQAVETAKSVYRDITWPYVVTYASYTEHTQDEVFNGGAEMGDLASDARRDFLDTAAFLTGVTDSLGAAQFSFKLPDNITAWRVTAQVVGENSDGKLCAGNAKIPLYVSKPLFLTVNSLDTYIEGDDITISARAHGNGFSSDSSSITSSLIGTGFNEERKGAANEGLRYGKLPRGDYTLLVKAGESENSDAVELPLSVVTTALEVPITRDFLLSLGIPDINPLRSPFGIYFYNNEYVLYNEILRSLSRAWDNRADFRIARAFAHMEYGYIEPDDFTSEFADITNNSIARLYPYSETDYTLTALICAAAPEIIGGGTAREFYARLYKKDTMMADAAVCFMGLAALNEPVLLDIISILESDQAMAASDKLRLTAALALLGDEDNARKYYFDATNERIIIYKDNDNGDEKAHYGGTTANAANTVELTALSLITASVLNLPEAEGMARYLLGEWEADRIKEQTVFLELITYLRHYTPKTENEAVFAYTRNGAEETITLSRLKGTAVRLTIDEFKDANFKLVSGDIGCVMNYTGRIDEETREPELRVTKTYTPAESGGMRPGALVKVTVKATSARRNSSFVFYDVIPSGARFDEAATRRERSWVTRSGQNVSGFSQWDKDEVVYYIRLVTPGEFVSESAAVYGRNISGSHAWGMSDRGVITIE